MNKKIHDVMQVQDDNNYSYAGIPELWTIEKQLKNYNRDIVVKFSKFISPGHRVLEYGAGIGTLSQLLTEISNIKPDCLEIDIRLRDELSKRGFNNYASISQLTEKYDAVYFSNVLEHIEDDETALRELHLILKDEGLLIIYVPAFMLLYSEFDASVGHYRRYNRSNLSKVIENAGFTVTNYQYVDSIGFFVWLLLKWRSISMQLKSAKDDQESHRSFQLYDRYIYPVSKWLDSLGLKYILGKNLLMVAKRK